MDPRITSLAARQHGIVGRRQLLARGLPPKHLDALVRDGRVRRLSRGTYLIAGAPMTRAAEAVAAAYRCGPDAVVVGEPIMAMLGIHTAAPDAPLEVLVRPGRRVTGVGWCIRTNPRPTGDDRAVIDRIPSLTPARLLIEAAVGAADDGLRRLVDGYRWTDRLGAVRHLARRCSTHPGVVRLVRSGFLDGAAPESGGERRLLALLRDLRPDTQVWLTPAVRVDFVLRRERLVIEYDGPLHGDEVRAQHDSTRDETLRGLGYAIARVTARELDDDPAEVSRRIHDLAAALGARSAPSQGTPGFPP